MAARKPKPPAPPTDEPAATDALVVPVTPADERVRVRFVDVQAVMVAGRIVRYGDDLVVTVEQLAADPRFIPYLEDWTPDPAAVAAATLEG